MAEESERFSLSRWSRRKLDAKRAAPAIAEASPVTVPPEPVPVPDAARQDPAGAVEAATPAPADDVAPLPPVESLSIDSDFRPFMSPKVDEATKRAALRKLFSDPRFNVMDGLDVYIDDYTKPDPMPEGMLAKIVGVYDRLAEESAARDAEEAAARAAAVAAPDDAAGDASAPATEVDATQPAGDDVLAANEGGEPSPADGAPVPPLPQAPHA